MKPSEQNPLEEAQICAQYANAPDALIEILHDVQTKHGFIAESSQIIIAEALNITRAEVHGVVSFYDDFKTSQPAQLALKICRGEACQAMGANELLSQVKEIAVGKSISVEPVYCLGNCALAPAAMIGSKLHGQLNSGNLDILIGGAKK